MQASDPTLSDPQPLSAQSHHARPADAAFRFAPLRRLSDLATRLRHRRNRFAGSRAAGILALCGFFAVVLLVLCVPEPAAARRLLYWVLLVYALVALAPADLAALWRSPLLRAAAVFYLYLGATLLWADEISATAVRGYAWRMTGFLLFITFTAHLAAKPGMLGRVPFLGAVLLSTAVALISMGLHVGAAYTDPHRLTALAWRGPNSVGAVFGAIAAGALAWSLGRGTPPPERLVSTGAAILLATATLLTMSRASIVAMTAGVVVAAVCARAWRLVLACAVGLAALAALLLVDPALLGGLIERGSSFRPVIWENYLNQILERPWFGYSIIHDGETLLPDGRIVRGAHNIYLEALMFGGIPALLGLLALLAVAGRIAWRAWREDGHVMPIAFVVYIATHGLFESQPFVHELHWHWLSFLLPVGLIAGHDIAARGRAAARSAAP